MSETFDLYEHLAEIAVQEFGDIVVGFSVVRHPSGVPRKLRLLLADHSFTDIWISGKSFAYHWQCTGQTFYRHDNAPHPKWRAVRTFPKHFHDGEESRVRESHLSSRAEKAIRQWLAFIRSKIS